MHIAKPHHRARIVKGWAFSDLLEGEKESIKKFLQTGNTDDLPERYQRKDYSIYMGKY